MNIISERNKRNYIIIALCLILVVMGVGYAAFSQLLTINVTSTSNTNFCLGFVNTNTNTMEITKGVSTGTAPTGTMSYSGTACGSNLQPDSSLSAHFYQPGDEIEYTLTIKNASTIQVAIKSILVDNESVTSNTTKKKGNITYIVEMPSKTTLGVNESTTMKVIAKFQNETDVTGNVNGETQSIEVKINAEQDDGNGGMITNPKFTGTIYRNNTIKLANHESQAEINGTTSTISNLIEGTEYVKNASSLNSNYYLKHDVVDDIITTSYVCFVYNNTEHCMKGGDGGTSYATNTQIIKDYQTFYNLSTISNPSPSNPGCNYMSNYLYCRGGGFNQVDAYSTGFVVVGETAHEYCIVYDNGSSDCSVR